MSKLKVGQPAPDVPLKTVDGELIQLSQAWSGGRNGVILFLRHLA
ncbi:MAG: hypothetical protein AAF702_40810 [Chloroflexota bacterium]